jgi:hypothetical protein
MSPPYRDPLPVLVAQARERLATLRAERAQLEVAHDAGRAALERKIQNPTSIWARQQQLQVAPPPRVIFICLAAGVVLGLLMAVMGGHR